MHTQSLTPQDATGLLSLIGLIALFVGVLFLIRRTQLKRLKQTQASPAPAAKPFPQVSSFIQQLQSLTHADLKEKQLTLQMAFQAWQSAYHLRDLDGNTEFLRGETQKRGLRYQLTNTSLAQGLALVIQVQMAQDGDDSRGRFERLLAYLLAHPAQDQPALSSWLSMPDLPASPRLEPDLHAEAWILFALLVARQQWGGLQRFDLDQVFKERSQAFLNTLDQQNIPQSLVYCPFLFRAMVQQTTESILSTNAESVWKTLNPLLRRGKKLPGRQEALSLLQIGLDGLFFPDDGFADRSDLARARLERALSDQGALDGEVEEGFSRLASFSCCVPLALPGKHGDDLEQLWLRLAQAQPARQDALGASLRLIAMMSIAGTLWLGKAEDELPLKPSE